MQDSDLLLNRLIEHKVEFVIVGGFAAVAHGVKLVTQDMDVCAVSSPSTSSSWPRGRWTAPAIPKPLYNSRQSESSPNVPELPRTYHAKSAV